MKAAIAIAVPLLLAAASPAFISQSHNVRSGETWGNRTITAPADLNGVVRIAGNVKNVTVENLKVDGAYRVIENVKTGATVDHFVIRNVHATNIRRGLLRIGNDSSGVLEDSSVVFAPEPQIPPHLPSGLQFEGTAHDWTIRNVTVSGAQMVMDPKRYWNGDGVTAERGTRNFRIINVTSNDNTDSGFDLKGENFWLDNVSASGNTRNFRFWTSIRVGTMTVGDTLKRGGRSGTQGVWVLGNRENPPTITIEKLIVRMTKPVNIFAFQDGPANLSIGSCDIQAPPGTKLIRFGLMGKIDLGPGCTLPEG